MGTLVSISVVCGNRNQAMSAMDEAFRVLQETEDQTSKKILTSFTSQVNDAAGKGTVSAPAFFIELLQKSVEYSHLSHGAFDVTIGPITALWNFEDGQGNLPDPEAIDRKLPLVDYRELFLDKEHRVVGLKKAGAMIDLGGIAKGFGVDRAVSALKEEGMAGGIVSAGGDVRLFGKKPGGKIWHVGIQHPRRTNEILASLKLTDKSIVSSGDYERFFLKGNLRYHHILDPKTGWPAKDCQSVTIVSKTALEGDALSTAMFILGTEKGMALIEELPHTEGLIVDGQGKVHVSAGLKSILLWRENSN